MELLEQCRIAVGCDLRDPTTLLVGVGLTKQALEALQAGKAIGGGGVSVTGGGISLLIVGEEALGGSVMADGVDKILMQLTQALGARLKQAQAERAQKN